MRNEGSPLFEYFCSNGRGGGEGGLREENSLGVLTCCRIICRKGIESEAFLRYSFAGFRSL